MSKSKTFKIFDVLNSLKNSSTGIDQTHVSRKHDTRVEFSSRLLTLFPVQAYSRVAITKTGSYIMVIEVRDKARQSKLVLVWAR